MNRILILLVSSLVLTACSVSENLELVNDSLKERIESFTQDLPDHFLYTGENVLTVSIYDFPSKGIGVTIWNGTPAECKVVLGYFNLNEYKVYFESHGLDTQGLVEKQGSFQCDFEEIDSSGDLPPPNTRFAEVDYWLENQELIE